jgi:formylglycine-generating enzyme required for sulfatase activity/energy-coupling factor transporter ATP-binding protein EcfA2
MAKSRKTTTEISNGVHAQRDAILGDQYNITQIIQIPAFQPPPDLDKLRRSYLAFLQRAYRVLDFRGIPQLETFSRELRLEDVYVPLVARPEMPEGETWLRSRLADRTFAGKAFHEEMLALAGKGEAAVPEPVEKALGEHARVVVLGDPGSGKSTLLKYLTLRLAAEKDAPLPILLPLNAYARLLKHEDLNLQRFLARYFAGLAQEIASLQPLFDVALEKGQVVVLLDGLDEVQTNRSRLVHKVEAFAAEVIATGNKIAVTSRIVGYKDAPLDAKSWSLYTLIDFDREAIEQFARRWCLAFEKSTLGDTPEAHANAEKERRELLKAIENNPGVRRLASNPLLLTILALIKRQGVALPSHRVELYELYLETLVRAWNKARALDREQFGPDLNSNEILAALGPLAIWLREENPSAGVVPLDSLLSELTRYYMGEEWRLARGPAREKAQGFVESVRRYSNLLVERGPNQYGFLHLTFEEMLAAYGLYQKGQLDLQESLMLIQSHLTDPAWRETILLAVGVWGLANRQPRVAGRVVEAMLGMDCPPGQVGQNLLIAGASLEDIGEEGLSRVVAERVRTALLEAACNRDLPPVVQRDAGFSLARSGWLPPDLDAFITIPTGPFLFGYSQSKITIEIPFQISKYPVTNFQFQKFIAAGGYNRSELWSEEGWAWYNGVYVSKTKGSYEEKRLEDRPSQRRNEPFYWRDRRWNNPLAPVVGVSWFEAQAYCTWLGLELGKRLRLPTEVEWERAARGTDGREYPWGQQFDRHKLNCAEFWAEDENLHWDRWIEKRGYENASTTIVIQYSEGNSPDGISDFGGNVWEWTDSWMDDEQVYRIICGGSWYNYRLYARCAYRDGYDPGDYYNNLGFRVVSSGT